MQYIMTPGDPDRNDRALEDIEFEDEDGNDVTLDYDDIRKLSYLPYYYNHIHNRHGHGPSWLDHIAEDRLDITRITEDEFLDWCYMVYDPNDPTTHVKFDEEIARALWRRRHPDSPLNDPAPNTNTSRGGNTRTGTTTTDVSTSNTKPNTLKKNINNYQPLSDDAGWDAWFLDFKTTSVAEGTNNVLERTMYHQKIARRRWNTR